jgi:hypothetical protein
LSILLHLARQGKLDAIHARGVLKDATGLHIAINEVDQLPNIF